MANELKQLVSEIEEDIYRYRRYRDYPGLTITSPKNVQHQYEQLNVLRQQVLQQLRAISENDR